MMPIRHCCVCNEDLSRDLEAEREGPADPIEVPHPRTQQPAHASCVPVLCDAPYATFNIDGQPLAVQG